MRIPEGAERIISRLEADGYEAFVVGGCVRDMLMGRVPEDWDITTSASPMQIKELFRRTIDTGLRHGTVTVMDGNVGYEVTTYRVDGVYEDYRHPQKVTFTKNLHEDLKRRDFTINAMAYNPRSGIVDLYGGQEDIASKIIRSVGNAKERFSEDALRMLRAVRFAGQLGFSIEEQTFRSICELAPLIRHISKERIRVELSKLLISDGSDCFRLIEELCLLTVFLPEWSGSGYSLSFVKEINILCKTNRVSVKQQVALLFAALLHENTDSKEAGAVCRRLTFDNDTIKLVERLIACQDKELPGNEV
ncbi:MAG: CCA tRNA nucleotidyltransferase, partial [Lachnoclostridium sp.]|nr:CCA tRNA nucleotidyltransferase [Lachnoclostridium sp.]